MSSRIVITAVGILVALGVALVLLADPLWWRSCQTVGPSSWICDEPISVPVPSPQP